MTQFHKQKQVTACNVEKVYVYRYSKYENEVTGLIAKPTLISECHDVLAVNDRLIVLNDDSFTSLTIDGTSYAGKHGLDTPALYIYIDDQYYGNGILFNVSSSKPLEAYEIQDMIVDEYHRKTRLLVDIDLSLLDFNRLSGEVSK